MNRLKLWLLALLLIGAAGLSLFAVSGDLVARALQLLDGRLAAASARVTASQRALQGDAGAVAALAARDPALIHALAYEGSRLRRTRLPADPTEETAAQQAARVAVAAAEAELGVALPQGARFTAAQQSWLEARSQDPAADAATLAFLRETLESGKPRRGYLRAGGGVSWGAAVPSGVGVLGVFVPVDAAWVDSVAAGSGVDVTISAPGLPPVSSTKAGADALVKAATPGAVRDAGQLAPMAIDASGVKLGERRLLRASPPAHRVLALPLGDLKDGMIVLSVPTQPLLAPVVELQWRGLVGLALAAVLALLFGLLLGPAAAPPDLPAELVSAADRIGRGDFDARAPVLAGRLGTVAAALNHAAAAAAPGSVREEPAAAAAPGSVRDEPTSPAGPALATFASLPQSAAEEPSWASSGEPAVASSAPVAGPPLEPRSSAPDASEPPAPAPALVEPAPSLPPAAPAPTLRFGAAALGGASAAAPAFEPPAASPAALLQAAARAAPPDEASGEDEHWREVFREFIRVRGECGESTQGLTYERLRAKLDSNRATLVAKYGCRTVRFQVYVKEGKTALKATPVR